MGNICCSQELLNNTTEIEIKPIDLNQNYKQLTTQDTSKHCSYFYSKKTSDRVQLKLYKWWQIFQKEQIKSICQLKEFQKQNQKFFISTLEKSTYLKLSPDLFIHMKREDLFSQYSIGKALGEGAYGQVSLVTNKKTGIVRAMKAIKKDCLFEEEESKLFQEMHILKDLDHPNIVKLQELFQDEKCYYLITEFLNGGELFDRIQKAKTFCERDAANIMKQILSAVAYCHSKQIVHRDLKPENIIFTSTDEDAQLKIIDFGTSRRFDNHKNMTKRLGTPYYIAPEVSCIYILFFLYFILFFKSKQIKLEQYFSQLLQQINQFIGNQKKFKQNNYFFSLFFQKSFQQFQQFFKMKFNTKKITNLLSQVKSSLAFQF